MNLKASVHRIFDLLIKRITGYFIPDVCDPEAMRWSAPNVAVETSTSGGKAGMMELQKPHIRRWLNRFGCYFGRKECSCVSSQYLDYDIRQICLSTSSAVHDG